jgi:prepilin-type N-terminal cleavage/methylation domain-containing protein
MNNHEVVIPGSHTRLQRGFSLIEMMVVIAIIGITAAIIVPNVINYRERARVRASASEMLAIFRTAQVEAVKRNYNMVILFDAANAKATTFLDNGQGGGTANNGTQDGSEPTIRELKVPAVCSIPDAKITFTGKKTGFTPRGLPLAIGGAVEIYPINANLKVAYKVSLSMAGHSKLEASTDGGTTWK